MDLKLYKKFYARMLTNRKKTWELIEREDFDDNWFTKRPSPHQWAIDEIMRHILANEVRYLQIPLNPEIEQHPLAVKAQWVGNILFELRENEHFSVDKVKSAFHEVQKQSQELIKNVNEDMLEQEVKAPWGEMLQIKHMLEDLFEHTEFHRGQVHFLITYFRGLPDFEQPSKTVNYG